MNCTTCHTERSEVSTALKLSLILNVDFSPCFRKLNMINQHFLEKTFEFFKNLQIFAEFFRILFEFPKKILRISTQIPKISFQKRKKIHKNS